MFSADFISISFSGDRTGFYGERASRLVNERPFTFTFASYRGLNYKGVGFIGYDGVKDRTLLSLYGNLCEDMIIGFREENVKVNRLDLQKTVETDNPDGVIEMASKDNVPFKRLLVQNVGDKGSTLYVGSSYSEKRLRLYNKSAQMGDPNGRLLRMEMVYRGATANAVWTIWRQIGTEESDEYTRKEVIKRAPSLWASGILNLPSVDVQLPQRETSTRQWIENIVKPAIVRLSVRDPELVDELFSFMVGLLGNSPNR